MSAAVRIPGAQAGRLGPTPNAWRSCTIRVTFGGLITPSEWFERDTIAILKRLSRRPIEPAPDSELMADLGFDSLQVLELVGELEDHFQVAVPLNALTHIRTVGQIAGEVQRLVAERDSRTS